MSFIRTHSLVLLPVVLAGYLVLFPASASALSCLETGQYLTSVVNTDDTVIFTGTVTDTIDTTEYTAEVLTITSALQGYIEQEVMVYHQKHPDWGYLCNTGPAKKGDTSIYVATRNDAGQYQVGTRLEIKSELAATLEDQLTAAAVTGEILESTRTDRANQIMSTIGDLFKQITMLLREYTYWSKS
ncbi:MAG: hypothetical protein RLZZ70_627 [Candidatus Parcubacteria bacterium]